MLRKEPKGEEGVSHAGVWRAGTNQRNSKCKALRQERAGQSAAVFPTPADCTVFSDPRRPTADPQDAGGKA